MGDGARRDLPLEVRRPRDGLLLGEALMRPGLFVEGDECDEEALEVVDVEQEEEVEQLAAERADEGRCEPSGGNSGAALAS